MFPALPVKQCDEIDRCEASHLETSYTLLCSCKIDSSSHFDLFPKRYAIHFGTLCDAALSCRVILQHRTLLEAQPKLEEQCIAETRRAGLTTKCSDPLMLLGKQRNAYKMKCI